MHAYEANTKKERGLFLEFIFFSSISILQAETAGVRIASTDWGIVARVLSSDPVQDQTTAFVCGRKSGEYTCASKRDQNPQREALRPHFGERAGDPQHGDQLVSGCREERTCAKIILCVGTWTSVTTPNQDKSRNVSRKSKSNFLQKTAVKTCRTIFWTQIFVNGTKVLRPSCDPSILPTHTEGRMSRVETLHEKAPCSSRPIQPPHGRKQPPT